MGVDPVTTGLKGRLYIWWVKFRDRWTHRVFQVTKVIGPFFVAAFFIFELVVTLLHLIEKAISLKNINSVLGSYLSSALIKHPFGSDVAALIFTAIAGAASLVLHNRAARMEKGLAATTARLHAIASLTRELEGVRSSVLASQANKSKDVLFDEIQDACRKITTSLLSGFADIFPASISVSIMMRDKTDNTLRIWLESGNAIHSKDFRLRLDEGAAGLAWTKKVAVYVPDTHLRHGITVKQGTFELDEELFEVFLEHPGGMPNLRCLMCVPVIGAKGNPIAVLNFNSTKRNVFRSRYTHRQNAFLAATCIVSVFERLKLIKRTLTRNANGGLLGRTR